MLILTLLAFLLSLTSCYAVALPTEFSSLGLSRDQLSPEISWSSSHHSSSPDSTIYSLNDPDKRAFDLPTYITGALSGFRADSGVTNWQLTWSSPLAERAQTAANQCDGNAATGGGGASIRGTVYESINAQSFDTEAETQMALVFWFIEQMEETHPNADSIRDANARFVGCAWSVGCGGQGNDHYLKCVLAGKEDPGRAG